MKTKSLRIFIIAVLLMVFSLPALANSYEQAQDITDGDMLAEWLVRPASALGTALGFATFLAGLPFSVMADNTEQSFENLVEEPFEYTFHRPLGFYPAEHER